MRGNRKTYTHKGLFSFLLCVFFVLPVAVLAVEKISLYEIDIDIHEDSSITILETIYYDFGEHSRRGIFRIIPTSYTTPAGKRGIDLELLSVSRDGYKEGYKETKRRSEREIRIGDPNVYIEGEHVYRIQYEVRGAFNAFADFDELYWNAIGPEWNVLIENAVVTVNAPAVIKEAACYEGVLGATVECRNLHMDRDVVVAKSIELHPGNAFTIATALPKGAVTLPSAVEEAFRFAKSNIVLLLPLFVFIFMFRHWDKYGRDAKGRGTIIPQYEPPSGMSPLLMGGLIDGSLQDHDITAGIIYLAEQGYLEIERTEKKRFLGSKIDYILTWVGNYEELNHKEKLAAELVFDINVHKGQSVTFSSLQKDTGISTRRKRLADHIDNDLKAQGYFTNKPQSTTLKWVIAPIFLIFFGVVISQFFGFVGAASVLLSGVIVVIFGVLMPQLTKKGALAREHILGFKEFLSVTDKERLAFHNAPERTTTEFMEYLPFAIALGIEKKWAEQFKDFEMENPSWYRGGSFNNFNATAFAGDMESFGDSMSSGVTAAQGGSGSGGGGFSGGGMGGGGGGSW